MTLCLLGTTFDPTPLFPVLPYLKLSGDTDLNGLWTIDTTNQIIYYFQDTLCKVGPTPVMPGVGGTVPIDSSGYVTNLTLEWKQLEGVMEYEVFIYWDADAKQSLWSGTSIGNGIIATEGNNPAQLIGGTIYYWRLRAIEPVKSPWSEMWSFAPALGAGPWSPVAEPSGMAPSPGAANVPIRPVFTWQPAASATGYEFILARESEFNDVVVALTAADALSITTWRCDRDLDYSTTYFWKVRAINSTGYSNWGTSDFTTESAPSVSPQPQLSPQSATIPRAQATTAYLIWVATGIYVLLVVVLLVFIVSTRR